MAISNVFRLDGLTFPSNDIQAVDNTAYTENIQTLTSRGAGGIRPLFVGVLSNQPEVRFTTPQINLVLADVPLQVGYDIGAGAALVGYLKKMGPTAHVARATTSHQKATINDGIVYIERITLNMDGSGTADVVIACGYDGTNEPMVWAGSTALDTTELASAYHYMCGPCYINNAQVVGIQSIVIETGLTLDKIASDGEVWPSFVGVATSEPKITLQTNEMAPAVTATGGGVALDGSNGVVCYGRKVTQCQAGGVARVADATEEHLEFTMLDGFYYCEPQGSGSSPATNDIICMGRTTADSTAEISYDTTAAIP